MRGNEAISKIDRTSLSLRGNEAISKIDRTLSCHCEVTKQSLKSIELRYPVIARHEAIPKIDRTPYPVIARYEAISKLDRTPLSCHCEVTKQSHLSSYENCTFLKNC
ncbi:hypothetical protein ACN4EE_17490 [Geminocystis sp. CENA526]|uniref:hypothetical protein n=1 Tax=Geminocystis sp. CENA526 TaxID=1355871 RepID=UPI003D6E733F